MENQQVIKILSHPNSLPISKKHVSTFTTSLHSRQIKVSFIEVQPTIVKNKDNIISDGFFYKFLVEMQKRTNISNIFIEKTFAHGFGQLQKTGGFDGLIGDILNDSTDLIFPLGITFLRYKYIDYTSYIYTTRVAYFIIQSGAYRKWEGIIDVLTPEILGLLLLSYVFLALTISLLAYFTVYKRIKPNLNLRVFRKLLEILLDQPCKLPKMFWNRLLVFLWILTAYFVGNLYKGELVSSLTHHEPLHQPKSLKQLSEFQQNYSKLLYSYKRGSIIEVMFQESSLAYVKSIMNEWIIDSSLISCMKRVVENDHTACIYFEIFMYLTRAKQLSENPELGKLVIVVPSDGDFGSFFASFGLSKKSVYKEIMGWLVR